MRPLYHKLDSQLEAFSKRNTSLLPHLHKYLECIYVTEGRFQLGIGTDWIDLNPHDMAVIFPDMIHQFRVDEHAASQAVYVLGAPALTGSFAEILQKYEPRFPVIRREMIHPDISYALDALLCSTHDLYDFELQQAYLRILLARILPVCQLAEKKEPEPSSRIWQTVSYISEHFMEDLSLTGMARCLGISPYTLSRIFSGVLHMNFNQYLNEIRLDYASHLLRTTGRSITDIFMDSGFSSQATFNRVFKGKYRLSPKDYRRQSTGGLRQLPASSRPETQADSPWQLAAGRFL